MTPVGTHSRTRTITARRAGASTCLLPPHGIVAEDLLCPVFPLFADANSDAGRIRKYLVLLACKRLGTPRDRHPCIRQKVNALDLCMVSKPLAHQVVVDALIAVGKLQPFVTGAQGAPIEDDVHMRMSPIDVKTQDIGPFAGDRAITEHFSRPCYAGALCGSVIGSRGKACDDMGRHVLLGVTYPGHCGPALRPYPQLVEGYDAPAIPL
ncbi:hypothetical protein MOV63_17955 [Neorhizobium sp. SHOUNA12A]|nr:hypothetical protein [Neorhizobium sp. SHOUNA12A]MCJ9746282.1 hypothetical protein [Neorhizobium sp. SHOUNA12A]